MITPITLTQAAVHFYIRIPGNSDTDFPYTQKSSRITEYAGYNSPI